jgi:hypothetical protein
MMVKIETEAEEFLRKSGVSTPTQLNIIGSDLMTSVRYESEYKLRGAFIAKFGFAILDQQTVEQLKCYSPILEVGCGAGYWAYEMRKNGIDVIATDPILVKNSQYPFKIAEPWVVIEKLSALEAIEKYSDRALLIVWPSLSDPWAAKALKAYQGQNVLYVGEGAGGCTADDNFHDILERNWNELKYIPIPNFWGIHDVLRIYERKSNIKGYQFHRNIRF